MASLSVASGCSDGGSTTDSGVGADTGGDVTSADASTDQPPSDQPPSDQPSGDGPSTDSPGTTACTPDPAALTMPRRCLSDDHCPCGAHCEYGRCVARCGAGLPACATGQRCDRFGRCRAMADQDLVVAAAPTASGRVVTESSTVTLGSGGEQCPLVLRVVDRPVPKVRIVASAGLQVQCPGGMFANECEVMSPPMNEPVRLAVRKDPAAPMTMLEAPGNVQIYGESSYDTVTVTPIANLPTRPLEGVYTGVASLVGVQSNTTGPSVAPPFRTEIPMRIRIFPGATTRVVEITDTLRALTSSATWVGTVSNLTATPGPLTLARRRVVSVTPLAGATASLSVRPMAGTTLAVNNAYGSLSGQLTLALEGVHPTKTPVYTWRMVLNRAGDLEAGATAPAASADEAPTNAMTLATTPTAAENAVTASIPSWMTGRTQADYEQLLASTGEIATPTVRRFDACGGSPQVPLTGWATLAAREWGTQSRTFSTPTTKSSVTPMLTGRESVLSVMMAPYLNTDTISSLSVIGWNPPNLAVPSLSGIACAVEFGAQSATICSLPSPRTENYGTLDRCDEMARTIGCLPETVTGGASVRLDGRISASIGTGTPCTSSVQINGRVTRVCRLRTSTPAMCAEWLTCHDSSFATVANGFGAQGFSSTVAPLAGDLNCGARSVSIDATRLREQGSVSTNTLLTQCIVELGRLQSALPAAGTTGTALTTLLRAGGTMPTACIEPIRHIVALSYAMTAERNNAVGMTTPSDPRAARLALRLWQQWLSLHSLLSSETRQQYTVDPSARGTSTAQDFFNDEPTAMRAALSGFALLLHPRFGSGLWEMPGATVRAPDYRVDRGITVPSNQNHQQNVGLPVVMADLMRTQLGLLNTLVERATFRTDRTYLDGSTMMPDPLVGATYRTVLAVLPLYMDLSARARAAAGTMGVPWAQVADRANGLLSHEFVDTQGRVEVMRAGRNPLGIEDNDLPLYFRGDPMGADARFSAVSNYLIGTSPTASGWATAAIAEARSAVTDVATAYRTVAQHEYMAQLTTAAMNTRLDEIRRNYGTQIANLCGTPEAIPDTVNVLEQWESVTGAPFDAETCYRAQGSECGVDAAVRNVPVALDDIKFALCRIREVNRATGNVLTAPDTAFNGVITGGAPDPMTCSAVLATCPGAMSPDERCLQCGMGEPLHVNLETLRVLTRFSHTSQQVVEQSTRVCRRVYPTAAAELPTPSNLTVDPTTIASCYRVRGSLGELSMGIAQATTDVDIARSEYGARQEAYDLAMNSCILQLQGDAMVTQAMTDHETTMRSLRNLKLGLDIGANVAGAAKDCFSAMQGVGDEPKPWLIAGAIGGCASAVLEAGLTSGSDATQRDMDRAEALHAIAVNRLMSNTAFRVCANNAAQELVGARSAALQIQRAMQDINEAVYNMQQGIENAAGAWAEGNALLQTTRERAVRAPEFDVWVESAVTRYRDAFRRAKRFTYLAMRAVEYEYQVTMSNRRLILGATRVEDLEMAMAGLRATTLAARINGNPPSSTRAVVSLREHLLQLHSTTALSPNEQRLSEVERFRLLLQNPRFAVFRSTGQWAGQRIPFSLAPLQTLGVGNASDVPIFASNSCAERIWTVNAMVEGAPDSIYRGSVAAFTAIDLEKTNSFYSQWCTDMRGPDGAATFQSASVRPAINLFRDPDVGAQDLGGGMVIGGAQNVGNGLQNSSTARMQPRLNVPRTTFAMDDFGSGSSSELAGRGLFGPYALFIPAESISRRQADGTYSNGLNMDVLTDILLRIDYVSVARPIR